MAQRGVIAVKRGSGTPQHPKRVSIIKNHHAELMVITITRAEDKLHITDKSCETHANPPRPPTGRARYCCQKLPTVK